jgi:hypothetical protein
LSAGELIHRDALELALDHEYWHVSPAVIDRIRTASLSGARPAGNPGLSAH